MKMDEIILKRLAATTGFRGENTPCTKKRFGLKAFDFCVQERWTMKKATTAWKIKSLQIDGYRPFREFQANMGPLEVLVGANGSGKSSLFEFLRFLRDSAHQDIPPEVIAGSAGQQIFHIPGPERFQWSLDIDNTKPVSLTYQGQLLGPIGKTKVGRECVMSTGPLSQKFKQPYIYMEMQSGQGVVQEGNGLNKQDLHLTRPNQLALGAMTNPGLPMLYQLREFVRSWRFYSSFSIANEKIRKSVPVEEQPILHEDAGNLSSVLHYLMTEERGAFDEIQQMMRLMVPGFIGLNVKARGGPGQVIAFWQERGIDQELSLADLSDGILRLLCWVVLCVHPHPPALICIDEPDQGVHPRTLPILAGLFQKASERTQVLLATHASYFLLQFDLNQIAVLRKKEGSAVWSKPADSAALRGQLEDFGTEELEAMHRNDELEILS